MLLIATLTAVLAISTPIAVALPATLQVYLRDENIMPLWALDTDPPSLDYNIPSTNTRLPIRVDHPFIVPVDHKGRPTGKPSVPSELPEDDSVS